MPSDSVTIVTLIIAAIPATILALLSALMTVLVFLKQSRIAVIAENTAKVTEVTAKTSEITHQLVNGSMLIQLRLHARTARQLANSLNNPVNEAVAVLAEKELQDHIDKKTTINTAIDNHR